VVELAIGLDFVKDVDKNWKKHVQSLDRDKTDEENIEIFSDYKVKNYNKTRIQNKENEYYWDYWKKRYWLLR
jgi:hypothetical protein